MLGHHDWRSGATRVVELALFELEARELETGEAISVWDKLVDKGDELFQRIWVRGVDEFASSSANRLISAAPGVATPAGPSSGSPRIGCSRFLSRGRFWRAKLLHGGMDSVQNGQRLRFLQLRAARIAQVVNRFLRERLSGV